MKMYIYFSALFLILSCSSVPSNRSPAGLGDSFNSCMTSIRKIFFKAKNLVKSDELARLISDGNSWRWGVIKKKDYFVNNEGLVFYNGSVTSQGEKIIPSGHHFNVYKGSRAGTSGIVGNNGVRLTGPISAFGPRAEIKLGAGSTLILYPSGGQAYVLAGKKTSGYRVRLLDGGGWQHTKNGVTTTFKANGKEIR